MSEHTKEPWVVHPDAAGVIVAASNPDLSLLGLDIDMMASFMNEHDARRVVACVNLCAGTPTGSIEAALAAGHTVDYIASRAEEMRDTGKALLAALKTIRGAARNAVGFRDLQCLAAKAIKESEGRL